MDHPHQSSALVQISPLVLLRSVKGLLAFVPLLVLALSSLAHAESLHEDDVIRLVQEQDPSLFSARALLRSAQAGRDSTTPYPNPSFAWEREKVFGDSPESLRQDVFTVSVPIELSSRRKTERHLAQVDVSRSQAELVRMRSEATARALVLFYYIVAQKERTELEERAVERLSRATTILAKRKAEGQSSGYDQVRLEIEREMALSNWRIQGAKLEQLQEQLRALLGSDGSDGSTGSFSGSLELGASKKEAKPNSKRRSLLFLEQASEHAKKASHDSKYNWVPTISLSGGPMVLSGEESYYGYAAGVSLDLPFFAEGQRLRAQARERQVSASEAVAVSIRLVSTREKLATLRLAATREEVKEFTEGTSGHVERLQRATESGYREGHRSIVELLDAQRTGRTIEERSLALALSSKLAELQLRAARGEFE